VIDGEDWYKYARNLTLIEGNSYGLPFAGDALMLLYRPAIIGSSPKNWSDILSRGEPLAFPAADPQALIAFTVYSSLQSEGDNPVISIQFDEEKLTSTFQMFVDGSKTGTFPLWVTQFQKDSESWTSFNELRSNWILTWSSRYLQNLQNDTSAVSFPQINEMPFTYADGWVWAIADSRQSIQPVSAALAEFLTTPEFLGNWVPASGFLPVRPSSLKGWQDQNLSVLLGQVALSARVKPRNENIGTIGPIIEDQLIQVLTGKATAVIAAQTVIEKLGNP
jgi:ABC-type glycerol-3-phosphate transport system substrate-binding protein